jgi:acyl-CoA synthetase (AMP-forming)/AMP-acid ligase II
MIKTGGVNVAPLEVEQVLLQHPDIVQAYVVGVPDQSKGEIVAAVVELRAGAVWDTASIVGFCRERLASYKVPVRLAIRSAAEFPRTPTGKIHKPRLRQELAAAPRHDEVRRLPHLSFPIDPDDVFVLGYHPVGVAAASRWKCTCSRFVQIEPVTAIG